MRTREIQFENACIRADLQAKEMLHDDIIEEIINCNAATLDEIQHKRTSSCLENIRLFKNMIRIYTKEDQKKGYSVKQVELRAFSYKHGRIITYR